MGSMLEASAIPDRARARAWPALPLTECHDTVDTVHRYLQIVGKARLALAPSLHHCWQVTLHVTPRGLTTSPMPCDDRTVQIDPDFINHRLLGRASNGA